MRGFEAATSLVLFLSTACIAGAADEWKPRLGKSEPSPAVIYQIPVPLPDFALVDQDGKPFTHWELARKWTFMFFGYMFCPDVCPIALADLDAVYRNLQGQGELVEREYGVDTQVVFISVDPERDTPPELKEYVSHFNSTFLGATGSKETIDSLTRPMGVAYRKARERDAEGDYTIDHSASFFLIDPLGRLRASFPPPHDPVQIATEFMAIRSRYTAECCMTGIAAEIKPLSSFSDYEEGESEEHE